jgi:hypothetical protein
MTLCYIPQLICHHRLFVYYRLAAIRLVLKNLQNADGRVRSMISTLALGPICLYIANACFHRPAEGFGWEHLIERCCQQVLEDPADDTDDEDAPTVPVLYDNGAYFICDIVLNSDPTFLRLPVQRSFDSESLIRIYHKASMDNIRSSFNWSAASLSRRLPNPERTHNRKRKTRDVDDIREPDRERLRLDAEVRGIRFKRPVRLAGRDVDLHVLNGDDVRDLDGAENDEQGELTASERIAKIYEQFFLDIIEEAPNRKSVQDGSYLSIPARMRNELARPELLQTADLPFTTAQYSVCTDKQWTLHFDRFFPETVENDSKRQNFGRCTYYINYVAFARAITKPSLARARRALRNQFDQLAWVPYTQSDRMWTTGKMKGSRWMVLPRGAKGGPAIAINPKRQREPITLRVFDRPEEGDSEGEEE